MSLYRWFYNNVIRYTPDRWVEKMGGTFYGLSSLFASKPWEQPVSIAGFTFSNPLGFPSGWADTPAKMRMLHRLGVGVVISKTITKDPRKGNPYPRLVRGEKQLINSMGLPNKGVDWWAEHLDDQWDQPIILSIRGDTPKEWEYLVDKLDPKADILELNFSCPNVHEGVMDLETSTQAVWDISSMSSSKIWLKLSPEYSPDQNLAFVNSVRDVIDGVTAINTLPVRHEKLGQRDNRGGLSGQPIFSRLLEQLAKLREHYPEFVDLPIFATGGIMGGEDALTVLEQYHAIPMAFTGFLINGPFFFNNIAHYIQENLNMDELVSLLEKRDEE